MARDQHHTILLLQTDSRVSSRIWADFSTISLLVEEMINLSKDKLGLVESNATQVNRYIDSLTEACCLRLFY